MHNIFVEGDNRKDKADKLFIETYLTHLFQDSWKTKVTVTAIGGYTQLNERTNEFNKATDTGHSNFIIFDSLCFSFRLFLCCHTRLGLNYRF